MNDVESPSPAPERQTAGGLLRQARQAKGLHIAALATSIKVAPRKLELLESDRYDELPGATFTRALAQTVCRFLKIDSAPVLALLPQATEQGLEQLSLGLNAPFRDRPGRRVPNELPYLKSPLVVVIGLLLIATLVVYLLPAGWINENMPHTAATSPAPAEAPPVTVAAADPFPPASAPVDANPVVATTAPAPVAAPDVAASAVVPPMADEVPVTGALQLRTSAESWVEVIDGRGASLLSRMLQPGETVGLDGPSPLRVKIGNATATSVTFKGKPVELVPTRDNVAKLELK